MARELPIFSPTGPSAHHGSAAPETIAMGGSVTPLRRHPDWIRSRLPSGDCLVEHKPVNCEQSTVNSMMTHC